MAVTREEDYRLLEIAFRRALRGDAWAGLLEPSDQADEPPVELCNPDQLVSYLSTGAGEFPTGWEPIVQGWSNACEDSVRDTVRVLIENRLLEEPFHLWIGPSVVDDLTSPFLQVLGEPIESRLAADADASNETDQWHARLADVRRVLSERDELRIERDREDAHFGVSRLHSGGVGFSIVRPDRLSLSHIDPRLSPGIHQHPVVSVDASSLTLAGQYYVALLHAVRASLERVTIVMPLMQYTEHHLAFADASSSWVHGWQDLRPFRPHTESIAPYLTHETTRIPVVHSAPICHPTEPACADLFGLIPAVVETSLHDGLDTTVAFIPEALVSSNQPAELEALAALGIARLRKDTGPQPEAPKPSTPRLKV